MTTSANEFGDWMEPVSYGRKQITIREGIESFELISMLLHSEVSMSPHVALYLTHLINKLQPEIVPATAFCMQAIQAVRASSQTKMLIALNRILCQKISLSVTMDAPSWTDIPPDLLCLLTQYEAGKLEWAIPQLSDNFRNDIPHVFNKEIEKQQASHSTKQPIQDESIMESGFIGNSKGGDESPCLKAG